ncbi:MAG: hypothetical protein WCX22_08570 [Methanoregula sp.]
MEPVIKAISCLVGLFVLINGVWIVLTPPFGDEPQGYAIIAVGFLIMLVTFYSAFGWIRPKP